MERSTTVKDWVEIIIWMGFIFWMSTSTFSSENTSRIIEPLFRFLIPSISDTTLHTIHTVIRKCAHLTEYTILGFLMFKALKDTLTNLTFLRTAAYAVLFTLLFAASDEFHQVFVSSRTPSPIDVSIDTLGGLIGQGIAYLWYSRQSKRQAQTALHHNHARP